MPSEYSSKDRGDQEECEDIEAILTPPKLLLLQQILAIPLATPSIPELTARNAFSEREVRDPLGESCSRNPPLVIILPLR